MKRRSFLKNSGVAAMLSFFASSSLGAKVFEKSQLLGFKEINASVDDDVKIPDGYEARVLISWGDAMFSKALKFDENKNISQEYAQNATLCFGDNNDGMSFFTLDEKRAILAVNNEYINPEIMFNHKGENLSQEDVKYEQANLGVSIIELEKEGDFYRVVLDSGFNRRIDANTKMLASGPAKNSILKTQDFIKGTLNNCANGQTPWGTYLTCEENVDDFFGSSNENLELDGALKRYGFKHKSEYGWEKFDERFDLAKNKDEANRFGWVVEIDPFDAKSTPIKRTALGRFKHENIEIIIENDGSVIAYMGDDEADEFLYKFVSDHKFNKANFKKEDADKILDEGKLYVARFDGEIGEFKGSGEWLLLEYGNKVLSEQNGFKDQADVLINARLAGTLLGATPMDRCEWIASHKESGSREVFVTLTNNKSRTEPNAANPRAKNVYGQILKFIPQNSHKNSKFKWEIFALAGNVNENGLEKGSNNITKTNQFNSPDGLKFDKDGRLWIQTDGDYSNSGKFEGMGNNSMLAADVKSGEIKRFLTGPVACEITGVAFNEDSTVMFVGIQHPGEKGAKSTFPHGKTPRSSVMMIRKLDGGVIGS